MEIPTCKVRKVVSDLSMASILHPEGANGTFESTVVQIFHNGPESRDLEPECWGPRSGPRLVGFQWFSYVSYSRGFQWIFIGKSSSEVQDRTQSHQYCSVVLRNDWETFGNGFLCLKPPKT